MDTRLVKVIRGKGFQVEDCPYTPLRRAWRHYPIVKAIREAEKETGVVYENPPPDAGTATPEA